ncbi:MAG: PhzF family phenazine biosynthesis protein [Gammaproteobacteria bacterium]|nr:PhzF family phenazine biosynthesis protein [Gammaproteobacteria bacterium]
MKKPFFITEVFAETPYGGNQLATVMAAGDVPEDVLQPIARAFNFAETTFMMGGDAGAGFDVRIFTPTTELPFAGHPTLGSAWLARREFAPDARQIDLNLGVGEIPVTFGDERRRLDAPARSRVRRARPAAEEVAANLGIGPDALVDELPCEHVSTGLGFVVVPVTSLAALRSLVPSPDLPWPVIAFCLEAYESRQDIAARMFAPGLGVLEDAATGSANGCTGPPTCHAIAYWAPMMSMCASARVTKWPGPRNSICGRRRARTISRSTSVAGYAWRPEGRVVQFE